MSARRKRAGNRQPARPDKNPSKPRSPAAPPRRISLTLDGARAALEECVGAICLVEVAMHSLESQEIASSEQEVLKRGLKAIWLVHDWIYELTHFGTFGGSRRTKRREQLHRTFDISGFSPISRRNVEYQSLRLRRGAATDVSALLSAMLVRRVRESIARILRETG